MVLATKTDGTLWTWGFGSRGELGSNNVVARSSPVQVGANTNWSLVNAGGSMAFAITSG
jgi:alpha-tubulin suppressor-like RCC1 family protein